MEYVYAAMLLHSAGKDIDDKAVGSVLKAAGVEADGARVKALVASLGSVDIDEAMATAVAAPVASAAPAASSGGAAEAAPAEEEAAEEPEEEAGGFEGLGSLFG
ncbi:MAG: 50S ribosomal protein P1 [Candidatus Thalassarchaeaceae archaeon]